MGILLNDFDDSKLYFSDNESGYKYSCLFEPMNTLILDFIYNLKVDSLQSLSFYINSAENYNTSFNNQKSFLNIPDKISFGLEWKKKNNLMTFEYNYKEGYYAKYPSRMHGISGLYGHYLWNIIIKIGLTCQQNNVLSFDQNTLQNDEVFYSWKLHFVLEYF